MHYPIRQSQESWLEVAQKIVGIVGGGTGILVAWAWLAGRIYYLSFFAAMDIDSSQVNFSAWEYIQIGWGYVLVLLVFYALIDRCVDIY